MNEATTLTTTTSVVTEQDKGRCAPAPGSALSPFAAKMLAALQRLTKQCEPHPCGGFTTDDMQWRMGTAFTPDETLWATLDELMAARLIRYCGNDDDDAIGTCYELLPNVQAMYPPCPDAKASRRFVDGRGAWRIHCC